MKDTADAWIAIYPYVIDVTGQFFYRSPMDLWCIGYFGNNDNECSVTISDRRWRSYFDYQTEREFDKYRENGGTDFLMFVNREDLFEFMLRWK